MKPTHLLFAALAFAGSVQAADLMQVYRDAQDFDAQYAAARAARDAGLERLPQGRAGLLPSMGFSAGKIWNDVDKPTDSRYRDRNWGVELSQPLFNLQSWINYKKAELSVASSEAQFAQASQELILRVAEAYFAVLLAQEALTTVQAQKIATAEQLESAKRNFEVGTTTITDTHEAQARHDLIAAQEIAAENDLAVKRQTLRTLTGKESASLKGLKTELKISRPQPDDIARWVESAETGNIGVQLAQVGFEIASREVEKQRAGHYPTLNLKATHGGSNSSQVGGQERQSSTISLQLSVPILGDGRTGGFGIVSSYEREAVASKEKARADLDNARRQATLAARQAYLGVTAGLAQVRALEAGVASSQLAVESNKLGYEVGVRINIDVLNAQSQLFDTRQRLAKARLDTLISQLRLKSAVGSLSADDLATINALLE